MKSLHLSNFKCFKHLKLDLKNLTLLTGVNAAGKSSIIQAILLLKQSINRQGFVLNGPLVSLGVARDVLHEYADEDKIKIGLEGDDGALFSWQVSADDQDWDVLKTIKIVDPEGASLGWPLFAPGVLYLAAERIGPRSLYQVSAYEARTTGDMRSDGSLAVNWYHAMHGQEVEAALHHPHAASTRIQEQAAQWMGEIAPGIRFSVSMLENQQFAELSFEFTGEGVKTKRHKPSHVGFGLSYTLPVVLACLAAKPGRLLLIENPEAHLHPRGQFIMGDLLARAAAAGAQVIVETHSDHVLNGVRLAVKEARLSAEATAIHFFSQAFEGGEAVHRCQSPQLDKSGRLSEWPEGFFDQYDTALERLL